MQGSEVELLAEDLSLAVGARKRGRVKLYTVTLCECGEHWSVDPGRTPRLAMEQAGVQAYWRVLAETAALALGEAKRRWGGGPGGSAGNSPSQDRPTASHHQAPPKTSPPLRHGPA